MVGGIRGVLEMAADMEEGGGVAEEELDAAVVANLPELIEKLEGMTGRWEELSSTMTINEIEKFADKVKMLGEEYGYPPIVSWSEGLAEQAEMFELDEMAKTLTRYQDLIAQLRSVTALPEDTTI